MNHAFSYVLLCCGCSTPLANDTSSAPGSGAGWPPFLLQGPFSSPIPSKLILIPFKASSPLSSNLSTSLRLQFTRATCSLQLSPSASDPQQQANSIENVIEILEQRGLLESVTSDALRSACSDPAAGPLKVCCGFDPTAWGLPLGNLPVLIVLSWFRRCGHKAVALIVGASARIGDPSGKSLERPELDVDTLEKNTSNGTKFGKSEGGAVSCSPSLLSPYKFYQYFFSVPDADVIRFLKVLTFLDMEEIDTLERMMTKPGYVPNTIQRRLAEEVTRFVHGEEGLSEALEATEALRPGSETKLDWKTIEGVADDVPSCSLAYAEVLNKSLVDLLVSAGLFDSKSAARGLLKQGGIYLNNNRVNSDKKRILAVDIVDGKVILLSALLQEKRIRCWSE